MTTLIIGSGLSGLACARVLTASGHTVQLLDKGKAVGGRLATRRADADARFDHGAQYFTARDPVFRTAVDQWLAAGVVREWTTQFHSHGRPPTANPPYPRYCGTHGMRGIATHLANGLTVTTAARVVRITIADDLWQVVTDDARSFEAETLVVTPPVPQTLQLLADSGIEIPPDVAVGLKAVVYDPCIALLVSLDGVSAVPPPGGVFAGPEPIAWVADNGQKGITTHPGCLTLHAGPEFSRTHYEATDAEIARRLLAAATPWLTSPVVTTQVHRWKYSLPTTLYPVRCASWHVNGRQIVLAGDAFAGPRVEGAYLSGVAAAEAVMGCSIGSTISPGGL
jgi:renalase